jgi:glycosyltransferase 2 family protein
MKRGLALGLGVAVAGLFLWLTLRHLDFARLVQAGGQVELGRLALAPLVLSLGYLCRIQRWRAMLRGHNPELGFGRAGVAFVGSIAANNLLPFRAGDVLRCFGFSRWLAVPAGAVLATVLVERLLDLLSLLIALALALWALGLLGSAAGVLRFGGVAMGAMAVLALALLLRPRLLAPLLAGLVGLAGLAGEALRARVGGLCAALMTTLQSLAARQAMPGLLGWSGLVWLCEGATYWAIARAIPGLPHPEAAWLAMPAGTLSTLLPSTPGHIGTFDYFAQAAAVAVGNPLAEATAFVLIAHVALWLPTTLIGGICLLIWGASGARAAKGAA